MDNAVFTFGSHVDHEMDEAEDKLDKSKEANKARQKRKRAEMARKQILAKYLYPGKDSIRGRFRDPAIHYVKGSGHGRSRAGNDTRQDRD